MIITETIFLQDVKELKYSQLHNNYQYNFLFMVDLCSTGSGTYPVLPLSPHLESTTSMLCSLKSLQQDLLICLSSTIQNFMLISQVL